MENWVWGIYGSPVMLTEIEETLVLVSRPSLSAEDVVELEIEFGYEELEF